MGPVQSSWIEDLGEGRNPEEVRVGNSEGNRVEVGVQSREVEVVQSLEVDAVQSRLGSLGVEVGDQAYLAAAAGVMENR